MSIICAVISLTGLIISLYALYVEYNLDTNKNYQPMCDIATHVSCSRAFRSSFAEGFGIIEPFFGSDHLLLQKNPVYGCIIYTLIFLMQFIKSAWTAKLSLVLSVIMNLLSVYLISILVYLRTVCLVCGCIYIVNALLLYFSYRKYSFLNQKILVDETKKRM